MKRFLLIAAGVACLTMYVIPEAHAAERLKRDVGATANPQYEKECGGCHFAYQPGWLPERSWRALMGSLERHFGENVALGAPARESILGYLAANSADRRQSLRSVQVLASIKEVETPMAISQVPYVAGIHGGYLDPAFRGEPKVNSLANCTTCHSRAASGNFSAVQYTVTDESFRTNEPSFAHALTPAEKLVLRKK